MFTKGARVAHYRVESLLGEGGMGQVYLAFDEKLHRRVALKVLATSDPAATQRMVHEARAAAALEHPNKVSVFELGEADGAPFIAMELIQGPTLRAIVNDRSIPWQDVVAWLMDVARVLDAAHGAGIVHRDIKPDNVMLRDDGVIKVLDFGIARRTSMAVDALAPTGLPSTTGGAIVGTAAYMAPEQVRGDDLDGRCDQFAWGVMAFELLTGEHPWGEARDALALLSTMLTRPPRTLADLRPDLPVQLSKVVSRTLSTSRDDRFPSMRAIVNELGPLIGHNERAAVQGIARVDDFAAARTELAASATANETSNRIPTGRRWWIAGLCVVGIAAAGTWALRRSRDTAHRTESPRPGASTAVSSAPVFPCLNTKRPFPPSDDRKCAEDTVAWCTQSGSVAACCAKGLVPDGDEGACGCPAAPSADPAGIRPASCPAPSLPALTPDKIREVVRSHFDEIRTCYEKALQTSPNVEGTVKIDFEIDPSGQVFFARIGQGGLPDAEAQKCALDHFRRIRFPVAGAGYVSVGYPISFKQALD